MVSPQTTRYLHYVLAVFTVAAVLTLRLFLEHLGLFQGSSFLLFSITVVIGSLYGGFGPGIVATFLAAIVIDYFFLPPRYTFEFPQRSEILPLCVFMIQGVLISWMAGSKRRAVQDLSAARVNLEHEVQERTSELQAANIALTHEVKKNRQMTDELRRYAEQLRGSHRELQDFASIASLDLQAPLRKVHEFADRLKTQCAPSLPEDGRQYVDRIQLSATRMNALLTSLIAFSRVTTRDGVHAFQTVDLNRIVDDVLSDLEPQINEARATVDVGDLHPITADPMHMRRLLQHLLSNAIKFRRSDMSPAISVQSRKYRTEKNGRFPEGTAVCEIVVTDNGVGFDEKHLDRLFNIFQRLHDPGQFEGTGVGLAICRKIVELHGGTITARSSPGSGSTFIVTLPCSDDSASVSSQRGATE